MRRKHRKKLQKRSNIISLGTVREENKKVLRKRYLSPDERLGELEADVLRLIEFSLELEERVDSTSNILRQLLRELKKVVSPRDGVSGVGEKK